MKKVINPARVKGRGELFCKIEIKDGALSISGVEGPMHNGNAQGSCGQIEMGYWHRNPEHNDERYSKPTRPADMVFHDGWTADLWLDFLEVWHLWHLNDTRPNCEHQTGAEWDTKKKVEVVSYKLTSEARERRRAVLAMASDHALNGSHFNPDATDRALAAIKNEWETTFTPPDADSPLSGCYEVEKRETKTAGWVYPREHPEGLLTKACPACGYKYGSAWRKKELPAEVIEFLGKLPETTITPAWV